MRYLMSWDKQGHKGKCWRVEGWNGQLKQKPDANRFNLDPDVRLRPHQVHSMESAGSLVLAQAKGAQQPQ